VDVAYTPRMDFRLCRADAYDLLLLDIMMGRGAEGIALARKIRKDPKLREMPVLIITGIREQIAFLFPGQAVHPNVVDVDELVEKPVEPNLLLERSRPAEGIRREEASAPMNRRFHDSGTFIQQ